MELKDLLGDAYKEGMTLEEITAVLADIPEPHAETQKLRDAVSKANSEAAEYKRQLKARMSAEESEKVAAEEAVNAMKAELETLRRERTVDKNTAEFLKLGYDAKLASETAAALVDGKMDVVFANQAKFQEIREKALEADLTKQMHRPPAGEGDMLRETFNKMTLTEKSLFKRNNPEAYQALMNEGGN